MRSIQRAAALGCAVSIGGLLAACGAGAGDGAIAGGTAAAGTVSVVASTNVWGDVAAQIGGDHVTVTSIISDPSADPHGYEADARNQLALSRAALVIENGGGYDDFVDSMLASSKTSAPVVNAVELSGKATDGSELNEHVWYDFPTVALVGQEIADRLSDIDPANAADYASNAKTFGAALEDLTGQVAEVRAARAGTGVAITEPVPMYLIEAAGLINLTPEEFSEAIENDTDAPVAVLNETLALFTEGKVAALFYNEQTSGAQTDAVLAAATDADVEVVPVRETLPDGKNYLQWMQETVTAMAQALTG